MGKPYVDYKAIKQRVDIVQLVERYGVQLRKQKEGQYVSKCPLPFHTNEKEISFGVSTEKGAFNCFSDSCKQSGKSHGNVIEFVSAMDGVSAYEAAVKLDGWFPGNQNAPRDAERNGSSKESVPADPTPAAPEVNRPLAFRLKDVSAGNHPMIQSRGISAETAAKFGVGFFPGRGSMSNRVVFPIYEHGDIVAYIGRTCGEITEENPKWKFPRGFIKSNLYGLERCDPSRPLVIVESPWAVLWLAQNNVQAGSLMGCELTPAQEQALELFKTIQLALDNDTAGREATEKLAERLRPKHTVLKAYFRE